MADKTHSLSIRLLREDLTPPDALRGGVALKDWPKFEGAMIAFGPLGGGAPGWASFLDFSADEKREVEQRSAFGLVFVQAEARWFAVSFGLGHAKLKADAFVQDFGLRVVLNSVDPKKLRSTDLRTPDSNTVSRRAQTSRRSEQDAFSIDIEKDIVRGLMGEPKDEKFGSLVHGGDALMLRKKMTLDALVDTCASALAMSDRKDYQDAFLWVDQIRNVRETKALNYLNAALVQALDEALKNGEEDEDLHLAYPAIYDPDKPHWVKFKGYGDRSIYPDLELVHYLEGLKAKGIGHYQDAFLINHKIQESDENGNAVGQQWKIYDCLVYEVEDSKSRYVLSGGRWYQISEDLAKDVADFFAKIPRYPLPDAKPGDNEEKYNADLAASRANLICLDRKLVKPSGATSAIETCDFLSDAGAFIHVKDKTSSSRLSHLFNQGTVSARVFKRDGAFRDKMKAMVEELPGGAIHAAQLPPSASPVTSADFTVVFAVLAQARDGKEPRLPFFSLVSFRQAARQLGDELGYKLAYSWIKKPSAGAGKKPPSKKRGAVAAP